MELRDNKLKQVNFEKPLDVSTSSVIKNKVQEFHISKVPCFDLITEQKAQYCVPPKNPKIVTRESRLEQFWWHTFYEDYLKSVQRSIQPHPMPDSEYKDNFTKEIESSSNEDLINKFPLYGSSSVTFYNQDGRKECTFRRTYHITKPVHLQDEQFG